MNDSEKEKVQEVSANELSATASAAKKSNVDQRVQIAGGSSGLMVFPIWLIAIYALGILMSENSPIFLWIACSFFLLVVLDPAAELLKRHHWPQALAAVFLILMATTLALGTMYSFGHLFSDMMVELEQSKKLFLHTFNSLSSTWELWSSKLTGLHQSTGLANPEISKVQIVQSSPFGSEMGGTILRGLGSAVTIVTFSVLVPILAFFLLAERDAFARILSKAFKTPGEGENAWNAIVKSTRAFFLGNLVLGVITYPVFVVIFWFFKVPSVFTVSALATFFNLVPFAGAALAGFLPSLTLYAQNQSIGASLGLYGACIVLHFAVADFVTPKILGSQVNINATTSTIALVAWGELWGGIGLILAIPLTSLIKILFEHSSFVWLKWIAELMSENVDSGLKMPTFREEK